MTETGTTTAATTPTTAATTTEPRGTPPARRTISVRTRITVAVSLLVAVSMALTAVVAYAIERQRVETGVVGAVDQELSEFAKFQQEGLDPDTGRGFTDARPLLDTFLGRNVPDPDELLVGWWADEPQLRQPIDDLTSDLDFQAHVRALLADGRTSERYESTRDGELLVVVQPVRLASDPADADPAALVIVRYLDQARAELQDTMRTYALIAVLCWLVVTAVAAWLSGRLLGPLRTLREATAEVTSQDLSRRIPARGNDDVTALTHTLNGMLDRLEAGFDEQRRFLDDAGHELKTPLTVMSGHLELLDPDDRDEVEDTRALLADEVDRMGRLVGDLVMLAKSRRPDFVTPQPTDVGDLTRGVLAKAGALGVRDWRLDGAAEGFADVDGQRLTQALLQLCDNAVKHTDPGQAIAVGSARDERSVRFWVRDAGSGVRPGDHDRIFERFGRSYVRPGDEGYGLGLSIVRAIAEAHGGSARVADGDVDGDLPGAVFTVTVPLHQEDPWPAS